jgi:hypothetical protein
MPALLVSFDETNALILQVEEVVRSSKGAVGQRQREESANEPKRQEKQECLQSPQALALCLS